MARLTYTNERGQSLTFGDVAPFLVTKIDGLGSPSNEIYRQKSPYQDGTTVTHSSLNERELVLEGVILSNARDRERYRRILVQVFNPKVKGVLTFERDSTKKRIECVPELAPAFPSNMQENYQQFLITLLCPNPFWQDVERTKAEIAIWRGALEFPLELAEEGIEVGFREPSLIVNVFNPGDVPCGMEIRFKALATVMNPSLFNVNTREYIKLNKTMTAGEVIVVTTHFGNKRVESHLNGVVTNAFNWLDLDSVFLQLDPGDNLLRYDAEEGLDNLEVDIYYTPQYLGV